MTPSWEGHYLPLSRERHWTVPEETLETSCASARGLWASSTPLVDSNMSVEKRWGQSFFSCLASALRLQCRILPVSAKNSWKMALVTRSVCFQWLHMTWLISTNSIIPWVLIWSLLPSKKKIIFNFLSNNVSAEYVHFLGMTLSQFRIAISLRSDSLSLLQAGSAWGIHPR